MYNQSFRANLLPFLILIPLVIILQYFILKPHLRYAFADVDWNFLLSFKQISAQYHDPISHFLNAWKSWGVYTYQVYYIGIIENFFGMDYRNFQIVTHFFKVIATLSIYPVILLITKSRLTAFLTALIYAVAYSSVGVMYTVVTSGLFVAIPVMSLFFIWYWHLINKGKNSILDIVFWIFLFFATILLATERMYPLVLIIFLIECFWWFRNNYSKVILLQILKRQGILLVLVLPFFLYKSSAFIMQSGNTLVTYQKFMSGNWQVLLSPIISLGSLFLPRDYWNMIGVAKIDNFYSYLGFLLNGPMFHFSLVTFILSFFLARKKLKFILSTLGLTFTFAVIVYILSSHQMHILESVRIHFDISTVVPALIGVYILALCLAIFKEWLDDDKKDSLLISLVGGMTISLIFILLTWIAADWILVFTGVHRYLTIPAIGSSLLVAGFITIIFNKLKSNKVTKPLAAMVLLLLIPIILFNANVTDKHFTYELNYAGTDASGHIRMKNKLWSYLNNFSKSEPSIFYFDESQDHDNGYFDETTIMAGFGYWMRFRGSDIVDGKLSPMLFRSNLICQEVRSMCLSKVKEFVTEKDGVRGILYGDIFYKPENFYAFRFVNRDIINIRSEVIRVIGLE